MPRAQTCKQENTAILHNNEEGGIAIICANPGKKLLQCNKETSWKSERSEKAKSSPTCCRQRHEYPPGYTVFECRVDGNQPIAQVVQVPSDTTDKIIQNKTCMLLETRQSESGPSSRVVAYPAEAPSCRRRRTTEPMSFALETRDCPGGAIARAEKVAEHVDECSAMCSTQPVTVLETTKGPTCRNGPFSQIVYSSVPKETEKSSDAYRPPGFHIQCTTTPEGPIAMVTQVPQELSWSSQDPGTTYEAFVHHDGSSPTALVTQCNKKKDNVQKPCEFLETRIDDLGPQARAFTLSEQCPNFRHFTHLDVRPQANGPFARISQRPGKRQQKNICNSTPKSVSAPNYKARLTTGPQYPIKSVRTYNGPSNRAGKPIMGKRNGLSPISSEDQSRTERLKDSRIRGAQRSGIPKYCSTQCCRPLSSPNAAFAISGAEPVPCASKKTPTSFTRSKSASPKVAACGCPVQHVCEKMDHPFSKMRPLPGGTVLPVCPPSSLPDIFPVLVGVNNFRDHKPCGSKPKSSGPRKPISAPSLIPSKPVKTILKPKKIAKTAVSKKKQKKKIKKTGSLGNDRISMEKTDQSKDKQSTSDPVEKYIDCPAFASKGVQAIDVCNNQSVFTCPALESKGSQSVRICSKSLGVDCPDFKSDEIQSAQYHEKPSHLECPNFQSEKKRLIHDREKLSSVECPAFQVEKSQPVDACEKPFFIECPAFEAGKGQSLQICEKSTYVKHPRFKSKGNQSVRVCNNQLYVDCPAFESTENQSVRVCNNQLYVDCPAFESGENQLYLVPEEPSYMSHLERIKSISRSGESDFVKCPGFMSRKSSETSSMYVPRDQVLVNKYSVDCCVKRNRLQDECRPHIPQTVLRMSYEQRRNRHARTLLSNGSLRQKFDDQDNDMGMTYCEPSLKSRKQDQQKKSQGPARSLKDTKKDAEIEKSVKSTQKYSSGTCKLGVRRVKSRELRAGIVYYDCDCYHRNGLQHDCPRAGCGGQKPCLNKPWPKCRLSCYFRKKWGLYNEALDLTPPTAFCGPRDTLYRAKITGKNCSKCQKKDKKLDKRQEDPLKIKEKPIKPTDKKTRKYRREEPKIKDECHQVHKNMVRQYAMVPIILDQRC